MNKFDACDRAGEVLPVRQVEANGLRFAYLEQGDGPLVLFLHGFPDNAWSWRRQLTFFANAGYRAVAPFLRGYAPTEIPKDGNYEPIALASDIEALANALGGSEPAFVVGMDWGGTSIFTALATAPDAIKAAVVMATPHPATYPAIGKDPAMLQAMFHLYYFQMPGADEVVGSDGLPFIDYLWQSWSPSLRAEEHIRCVKQTLNSPGSLKAALAYYPALFASARAGRLPVKPISRPTLTIYGSSDLSGKYARLEEPLFKGPYRRVMLEGVGHFPHLEREQEVNGLIREWLQVHSGK